MSNSKKILSISMVKNEMDVIESFIRYNINIIDGMIILDNGSTDHTKKIINQLQSEGYPIILLEDEDTEFDKEKKMVKLLHLAIKEYDADIIIPLDADEFLVHNGKDNPRKTLETLESPNYFLIKWKTYIPSSLNDDELFIPSKIRFRREEMYEKFYKVVIPKELVTDYKITLPRGSHNIEYAPEYDDIVKPLYKKELQMAHFPIRSIEQATSKVTVGWISALSSTERKENQSFHWKKIFNQLKENKELDNDDLINLASEFALREPILDMDLIEDPINLSHIGKIEMKYTPKKINPMANLLEACENLSLSYLNLKKDKIREEKRLKEEIETYKNSKSWVYTAPFRNVNNKLFKNHKSKKNH